MVTADPASELRGYVRAGVDSRATQLGRQRAIDAVARELGMSARRVLALLHGEVSRIWADELLRGRDWYQDWLATEERAALARAEVLALRRAAFDAQDAQDGIA